MKGSKSNPPKDVAPNNRIIVQNLSYDTTQESLSKYFSQFGTVAETEIPMNPKINRPKGFGFVAFSSTEEATKAVSQERHELDERNVRVSYAKPRENVNSPEQLEKGRKLYIGKLPWEINQEELKAYFEKFGTVEDAFLPTVSKYASLVNGYPVHKGFGFITYVNEEDANKAALHKNHFIKNEPISVRKAKPQEENRSPTVEKQSPSDDKKQVVVKRKGKQGGDKRDNDKQGKRDTKHEKSHEHKERKDEKQEGDKDQASPQTNNASAQTEDKAAPKEQKTDSSVSQSKSKPRNTSAKKRTPAPSNRLLLTNPLLKIHGKKAVAAIALMLIATKISPL